MSHLHNSPRNTVNGRPAPEVAEQPASTRPSWSDQERNQLDDATVFRTFLKRNLNSPPPSVPADLLGKILDRIDAVDRERDNK